MKFFKERFLLWILIALMTGCGGSSDGTAVSDPLATSQQTSTSGTPTGTGTVQNYTMTLTTLSTSNSTTVAANGSIIATAVLKDGSGTPIAGQPIKFEEVPTDTTDGVTIPVPVVETSNGTATSILRATDTTTNRDVIIQASTSIGGQRISAVSVIKVARSAGNYVHFLTTAQSTDPSGNLNELTVDVKNAPAGVPRTILQLVTFQVLDKDGITRTGVPVQLDVFYTMGDCSVDIGSPESQPRTVTTDNTGLGVFSAGVTLTTPVVGSENACSVVYRATTPDPYSTGTLYSYGAYLARLKNTY